VRQTILESKNQANSCLLRAKSVATYIFRLLQLCVQLCGLTSKLGLITAKTIPDDLKDCHRLHRVSIAHVFLDLDESVDEHQDFLAHGCAILKSECVSQKKLK
jgi:hypothetical protein